MIERYTRAELGAIWSEQARFQSWLDVEIAVCQAQADLGLIPATALAEIKARAKFDLLRIKEIEEDVP